MKLNLLFAIGLGVLLLGITNLPAAESLVVMTYNLRYASDKTPNAWPDRLPIMRDCVRSVNPDIFDTQEGLYHQLKELAAGLSEYSWIGLGRDGGSHGEFMAIFYKHDRFEPMEYDHFWLSDTPEVVASTTWGNSNRRMVTWVRFKDRKTNEEFYVVNTHFDHQIQLAREKSAQLLRERVAKLNPSLPVILTGDFNAVAGANAAYDVLVNDGFFSDTWKTAEEHQGDATLNSFNGFQPALHDSQRIDWILTRGSVQTKAIQIVDFSKTGQYPSDHFPVVAWLHWGDAANP